VTDAVAALYEDACILLPADVAAALRKARAAEVSPLGREVLDRILENARIAAEDRVPLCQDTGVAVVYLEVGANARVAGGDLEEAVNKGIRRGTARGALRRSVVRDPLDRVNTKDNAPAVIHTRIVPGNKLRITVVPKGAGSENKSALAMLTPADGPEGVKQFVLSVVESAGGGACPPLVVGVGLGGTMERAAEIAKEALLRPIGARHPRPAIARLETELLKRINELGIGPMGLGGRTTALAVHVESCPCHMASLPVAVNLNCHAARHREIVL
jgi:fumarate hydratase subunit alpha